ncbi:hypothetical protein FRC00_000794 [Tulasnella sp. 408]|nr:hypothetical protein FRC00_000794 [Tulasnella sp. 408]
MSQPSQDSAIPMVSTLVNAPNSIIIGANDKVSTEKLLQALNLPTELRERIVIQSRVEGANRRRFVITCPDYWAWDRVFRSVEHQSPVESITPSLGLTPGPSNFGTVLNTPAFSSPWATQAANALQSLIWGVQGSPYHIQGLGNILGTTPVFSEATPSMPISSSVFQSSAGPFKQEEASDDDRDVFAVAEGEEEYVQEWDARDAGMKEDEEGEDGESSPSGESSVACLGGGIPAHHYREPDHNPDPEGPTTSITNADKEEEECLMSDHNTGEDDSDQEMTEEDKSEAIAKEPITSGYKADHLESDATGSPLQRQWGTPHPRAALSPSDQHTISDAPSTMSSTSTAQIDNPPANPSTPHGTNNVLGPLLDLTEDEMMGDAAEQAMDGLVNGLSGLALPPPDEVQTGPSLQSGQSTTPGEPPQDLPDTSAESDVLRGMMEQSLDRTSGVDYVKAMAPVGHESNGFVEVRRE